MEIDSSRSSTRRTSAPDDDGGTDSNYNDVNDDENDDVADDDDDDDDTNDNNSSSINTNTNNIDDDTDDDDDDDDSTTTTQSSSRNRLTASNSQISITFIDNSSSDSSDESSHVESSTRSELNSASAYSRTSRRRSSGTASTPSSMPRGVELVMSPPRNNNDPELTQAGDQSAYTANLSENSQSGVDSALSSLSETPRAPLTASAERKQAKIEKLFGTRPSTFLINDPMSSSRMNLFCFDCFFFSRFFFKNLQLTDANGEEKTPVMSHKQFAVEQRIRAAQRVTLQIVIPQHV